jgi:hypothetical protein
MLVFWFLFSLVRNSVVLAVYLLLLKSGGFLCVGFPLIPPVGGAGIVPTLRRHFPL